MRERGVFMSKEIFIIFFFSIDVNILNRFGESAAHTAVEENNIEGLNLLLSHPNLTALTLNMKDNYFGNTPVMRAVMRNRLEHLEVLVADPRVDLDTTDNEGRSLEEVAYEEYNW